MELSFGDGQAEAILDMTTCRVVMYNAPSEKSEEVRGLHDRFGGRQYYNSLSGRSGAGSLPNSILVRPCGVLRTDVARPAVPSITETLPGLRLVVPTRRLEREQFAPLIVVQGDAVTFLSDHELPAFLKGEWEPARTKEVELTSFVRDPFGNELFRAKLVESRLKVQVRWAQWTRPAFGQLGLRRVLELLFWKRLYVKGLIAGASPWQRHLGLAQGTDGVVYHAAGGILRRKAELTREALQSACPWVKFVSDELAYITERDGEFVLLHPRMGFLRRGFGHYMSEGLSLTVAEAVHILSSGELSPELQERLQAHLNPSDRPRRLRYTQATAPSEEPLADWERELLTRPEGDE